VDEAGFKAATWKAEIARGVTGKFKMDKALECAGDGLMACSWAGGNPDYESTKVVALIYAGNTPVTNSASQDRRCGAGHHRFVSGVGTKGSLAANGVLFPWETPEDQKPMYLATTARSPRVRSWWGDTVSAQVNEAARAATVHNLARRTDAQGREVLGVIIQQKSLVDTERTGLTSRTTRL
jgi:hypothetical protein